MHPSPPPPGVARVIYVIGLLVAYGGAAIFFYAIITTMAEGFNDFGNPDSSTPSFDRVGELMPLAFGLAVPGAIVAGLASAIGHRDPRPADIQFGDRITGDKADRGGIINKPIHHNEYNINVQMAMRDIRSVQRTISHLDLPEQASGAINRQLDAAKQELEHPERDLEVLAHRLERATDLMERTGAFAQAGGKLIPYLRHLASAIGPAGRGLLQHLSQLDIF